MKKAPPKARSDAARALEKGQFRQRVVRSKKAYQRKPRTPVRGFDVLGAL